MKKQLPPRPNLEQLKKQAKAIVKGHRSGDSAVILRIRRHHPDWRGATAAKVKGSQFALNDAQIVIAREYGFASWAKLKSHVLSQKPDPSTEQLAKALREAAGAGDVPRTKELLDAYPQIIDERGGPGVRTALHFAVFGGRQDAIKLLLERGANPNIRCEGDYAYPLHFAAEKQQFEIIRLLVEHGADPIGEGDYHELGVLGWLTAWETIEADPKIVKYLLAHGARHNIFSAVATGAIDAIREIVRKMPSDLERRMELTNKRRYPLHLAAVKKQPESVRTLLDLGANIESLDESAFTPLDQAALLGSTTIAELLISRGAKIRLPAAIGLNRAEDIARLLRSEPDSLKPGKRWGNLIVRAAERSSGEIVERLIRAGADVNVRDNPKTAVDNTSGYTPLHAAAFNGNVSAVKVLLAAGANITAREEKYHGTPASWAAYAGHAEVHQSIIQGPVDLFEAIENGLHKRIEEILDADRHALERPFRDYPIYPADAQPWYTPLVFAVMRSRADVVRTLLACGANARVQSPGGERLSVAAEERGSPDIAALLKLMSG